MTERRMMAALRMTDQQTLLLTAGQQMALKMEAGIPRNRERNERLFADIRRSAGSLIFMVKNRK